MPTILAIDPGTHMGLAVLNTARPQTVRVAQVDFEKMGIGAVRLGVMFDTLVRYFEDEKPDLLVLEGYAFMRNGKGSFTLGEYGGVIRLLAATFRVPYVTIPPRTLQKFVLGPTKKGSVTKIRVAFGVARKWKVETNTDNEADAVALAFLGRLMLDKDAWKAAPVYEQEIAHERGQEIDRTPQKYESTLAERLGCGGARNGP